LTQPWPDFNQKVGPKSYWLLFGLNVIALISVIFILPETKGISLERMDKIFGQVDAVEAGEHDAETRKLEENARNASHSEGTADAEKRGSVMQVEAVKELR